VVVPILGLAAAEASVILMDISMPVMNGHEATRAIRKIEAARKNSNEVPVVPPPGTPVKIPPPKVVQARAKIFALTGLATADDKREAFGSGVDGYLVKPVSLKSLGLIFQSESRAMLVRFDWC